MADPEKPKVSLQRRAIVAGAIAATSQLINPISSFASTKRPASTGGEKMDIKRFVEDCLVANTEGEAQAAVSEVLARAVSRPNKVIEAVGEPAKAGLNVFLSSPELTIFAATWTPQMNFVPHDHLMRASIGIYTGREDNIFWERTGDGIEAYGADALFQKDTALLPPDALHSVTNPLLRFTGRNQRNFQHGDGL